MEDGQVLEESEVSKEIITCALFLRVETLPS
jgi:hypothetical protein